MATKPQATGISSPFAETGPEVSVSLTVNGAKHDTEVPAGLLLVDFLRDRLGLTGAKFGCETGQCGACTVLLNGISVKSCAVLAAQANGSSVSTIEGVAPGNAMTPLQNSLWENHAVQCGYCTPGLVLSLTDLLNRTPEPTESQVRHWMDGNLCRCGVYQNVVQAVLTLTGSK